MFEYIANNSSWLWTAYAMTMLIIWGTKLSVVSKKWDIFFTFIFPIFVATPLLIFLGRFDTMSDGWFAYAKLYSILFSASCVWYVRNHPDTIWGRKIRTWSFAVNVMEGVLVEATHGSWINPLAGLLIIATLPRWQTLEVNQKNELRWESSLIWVLAYTIWNNVLTINVYPSFWVLHTMHVFIAFFMVISDPKLYAMIRAISLNISLSLITAFMPALSTVISQNAEYGPLGSLENHSLFVFIYSIFALGISVLSVVEQLYKKQGRVASWFKLEKKQLKFPLKQTSKTTA